MCDPTLRARELQDSFSLKDGAGFVNTGVFNPPAMIQITFTKPGVYRYQSLIHTGMTGEVVVSGSP